jgi:hypothetical protein
MYIDVLHRSGASIDVLHRSGASIDTYVLNNNFCWVHKLCTLVYYILVQQGSKQGRGVSLVRLM